MSDTLSSLIQARFGESVDVPEPLERNPELRGLAAHRSHRAFTSEPVPPAVLRTLLASAFSAPAKSDLQQSCVVQVGDRRDRERIAALIPSMSWIADAPVLLVFCGDNRRIRRICALRGTRFANDHLDSFLNAAVDTGLVMAGFIRAAQAAGLGLLPLERGPQSRGRDRGGCSDCRTTCSRSRGWWRATRRGSARSRPGCLSKRSCTPARYDDSGFERWIAGYDARRHAALPLDPDRQRDPGRFGRADFYGWSEDKARQVAVSERGDFGEFVRSKRFRLD